MIDWALIQDQFIALGYLIIAVLLWAFIYFLYAIPTIIGVLLALTLIYLLIKLLLWAMLR